MQDLRIKERNFLKDLGQNKNGTRERNYRR